MELYRRPGSKNWWLTYSIGGKRFRESTGTAVKRQAEAVAAKREVELFEGRHFPNKKRNDLTIAGLRDVWLKHAKHKRSIDKDRQRFRLIVEHFGESCLVATLTKKDIEAFRDALAERPTRRKPPPVAKTTNTGKRGKKKGGGEEGDGANEEAQKRTMAPATVNRHLALLRSALRHVRDEYLHHDPMHGVKLLPERNQRERECEPDEYDKLLAATTGDMRLAIVLAHEAGLRRVEVCSALRDHVSNGRRELHVPATDSKNDVPRTVPLTKSAMTEIKAAPARMDGRLVGLDPDALTHRFSDLCQSLGITGLVFHDLRGTAITRLARAGASLAELQKFSGHRSVQALLRYLKRGDRRLRELVDKMDTGLP